MARLTDHMPGSMFETVGKANKCIYCGMALYPPLAVCARCSRGE